MGFEQPQKNNPENINQSRRSFLKFGAAALSSAVLGDQIKEETVPEIPEGKKWVDYELDTLENNQGSEIESSIKEIKEGLERKYNLNIELTEVDIASSVKALQEDLHELRPIKKYESLLMLEYSLAKYPTFMISESGLNNVILTTRGGVASKNDVSGYVTLRHLEAADRFDQPEMALAYDWNSGDTTPKKLRTDAPTTTALHEEHTKDELELIKLNFENTVHHEVLHVFIDIPGTENTPRYEEASFANRWTETFGEFNEKMHAEYSEQLKGLAASGKEADSFSDVAKEIPGFARPYALVSDSEDMSTIAEDLLTGYEAYLERDETDTILKQKVEMLKDFYLKLSCGLMDKDYWALLKFVSKSFSFNRFFADKAQEIISTPYAEYLQKDAVSETTYTDWQNKIKLNYGN